LCNVHLDGTMTVFRTFWLSEPTIEGINPKQNLLLYQLDPATYFMQKKPLLNTYYMYTELCADEGAIS
jgi:hypothetical protein